jgi:hypothetical protein
MLAPTAPDGLLSFYKDFYCVLVALLQVRVVLNELEYFVAAFGLNDAVTVEARGIFGNGTVAVGRDPV